VIILEHLRKLLELISAWLLEVSQKRQGYIPALPRLFILMKVSIF